jgi:hypothetical protein
MAYATLSAYEIKATNDDRTDDDLLDDLDLNDIDGVEKRSAIIKNGMNGSDGIVSGSLLNPFTTANFTAELNRRAFGGQPIVGFVDDEACVVCGQTGDADGYCGCFQSA